MKKMELPKETRLYRISKGFARSKDIPLYFVAKAVHQTPKAAYLYGHGTLETVRMGVCMACGRRLTHPVSVMLGIGPQCGGHWWDWDAVGGYSKENVERLKTEIPGIKIDTWVPKACIMEHLDTDEEVQVPEDHKMLQKKNDEKQTEQKKLVELKNSNLLKITFPPYPELVQSVKTLPKRQFVKDDPKGKYWTAPLMEETVEKLRSWDFAIDPMVDKRLKRLQASSMTIQLTNKARLYYPTAEIREAVRDLMTMPNPKYEDAVQYGSSAIVKIPKTLEFYKEEPEFIEFLRGGMRRVYEIIQEHGQEVTIDDRRTDGKKIDVQFDGTLREYQEKAVADILKRDFGVLQAATGSGKTVIALNAITRRGRNTLILVHTRELLYQWKERVESFTNGRVGLVGDGIFDPQDITIGMVKSVSRNINALKATFGHLIVDECHRTPSTTFRQIVRDFSSQYMLGLSATAYRRDRLTELINLCLGENAHVVDDIELRDKGAVLRPEVEHRSTGFTYEFNGDYSTMLQELTEDDTRNDLIATTVLQNMDEDGVVLVLSDRVKHLRALAAKLGKSSRIRILTGQTPRAERKKVVEDANNGKVKILLATIQLIGEGFDCAGLSTLHIATPFRYHGRLIQIAGRILRPAPGKTARIFDYVDRQQPVLYNQARERASALISMTE